MRSASAPKAQTVRTQGAPGGNDFERGRADSTSTGSSSTTDTGLGGPMSTLLETGLSVVGALRSVPAELQRKLRMIVSGEPTLPLDAATVRPSRWGGRHESGFRCRAFVDLKKSIQHNQGNLQPILVIELPGSGYEVVFGHRRHRACLELGLPVKALVWHGDAHDTALISLQDAENRWRASPSALDQGRMYAALIQAKVFKSQRELALAVGVSHTWVRKALSVGELPDQIVAAFDDPSQIQPKHAQRIMGALNSPGRKAVLRSAVELGAQGGPRSAQRVMDFLVGPGKGADAGPLKHGQQLLGSWKRNATGRVVITLEQALSSPEVVRKIEALLGSLALSDVVET